MEVYQCTECHKRFTDMPIRYMDDQTCPYCGSIETYPVDIEFEAPKNSNIIQILE